jgi:hypothetical protein
MLLVRSPDICDRTSFSETGHPRAIASPPESRGELDQPCFPPVSPRRRSGQARIQAHAQVLAQPLQRRQLHRGNDIVPIPGTRSRAHLRENLGAASVRLEPGLLARLEALVHNRSVSGQRYNAANTVEIDTERFT